MGVMKRMRDITVATLNERLEQAEDPVRMIDSYLLETADHIRESERLLNQVRQHLVSVGREAENAKVNRDKREEQALLAIKAGEDALARMALQEKLLHEEKYEQYHRLYEQTKASVQELDRELAQMKADYQEVYSKRQYYLARMESVRLQQRMNAHMGRTGRGNDHWFHRMEDRVSDMEIETTTLREVRRMGQAAVIQAGESLQHVLDRELSQLKHKLAQEGERER